MDAVSRAVAAVFAEPAAKPLAVPMDVEKPAKEATEWVPFGVPQAVSDPQPET